MNETWVPAGCTLPSAERPYRTDEFDRLFTESVRGVQRRSPTQLVLQLEPSPDTAARAAALVVRETACCSFFTFTLTAVSGAVTLDVSVPDPHADVLDAIAIRAAAGGSK